MIQNLSQCLQNHFSLNLARAKCMAEMIESVIKARSPRIHRIAEEFSNAGASVETHRRRIQNFLRQNTFEEKDVARLVMLLLDRPPAEKMILAIDRTNWHFGDTVRNMLVLAVIVSNTAVPLMAVHLDHPGNSDTAQRIALLEDFLRIAGADNIECLTGDREFIGEDWIAWLCQNRIPFALRMRENISFRHPNGGQMLCGKWFRGADGEKSFATRVAGHGVRLSGKHIGTQGGKKELLAVVSSPDVSDPLETYRKRWGIECLFKGLKTHGFNMEDSHIKDKGHFETLTQVMFLSFATAVKVGLIMNEENPIKVRRTVNSKIVSVPRYGMDHIRRFFKNARRVITIGFWKFRCMSKILGIFVT